jgi:alkaline phosphatase isozyme conversion protein
MKLAAFLTGSTIALCIIGLPASTPLTGTRATSLGKLAEREMLHLAKTYPGRMAGHTVENQAADYLAKRFAAMGYATRKLQFDTSFDFLWDRDRTINITSTNVVAERPGTTDKQIIIGAHFDTSIPRNNDEVRQRIGGPLLQGLDDNASGVGVLLELAARMQTVKIDHTIIFVAFGAEEIGSRGARHFTQTMTPKQRVSTLWMINLDSVITGDRLYFHAGKKVSKETPDAGNARDRALAIAKSLGIPADTNPGLNPKYPRGTGCCSDQVAFDEAGIPTLAVEATNWQLGDRDGYQQTSKRPAFPEGESWHRHDLDSIDHLQQALPGRVTQRAREMVQILLPLVEELAKVEPLKK